MEEWLKLELAGPLLSFGGIAIDQVGPTRMFPAASMLTGLIGNALGLEWRESAALQDIQDRLVFASALLREGQIVTDTQNVQMQASDKAWTTWGVPAGRNGASYGAPHRRRRDFLADALVVVALRLLPGKPDTAAVAQALDHPARPLFIGRKPCFPTRPILAGTLRAETAFEALCTAVDGKAVRAQWPEGEGPEGSLRTDLADQRNWAEGFHSGTRRIVEGTLA